MAEFYSNLVGRPQCSVFNVIRVLEDLEVPLGFSSGGDGMRGIMNYVESMDEVPFAQSIPPFPVIRERRSIPSFEQMGEAPPSKHILAWLPALPVPHTYISHTEVDPEGVDKYVSLVALQSKLNKVLMEIMFPFWRLLLLQLRSSGVVVCVKMGVEGKTNLSATRPIVHFKFKTGKKLIGESLDARHQKKMLHERHLWVAEKMREMIRRGGLIDVNI
ncbi:hypothetical protein SESBI_48344 [Sesbania bispinosa]|nr:hypothetical protein SESBI_48344 [Sesbania bispinosa]